MSLHLITAPTRYPVTLQEVKDHLHIDDDEHDAKLDKFIVDVTSSLDAAYGWLGRCLVQQTWELRLAGWPCEQGYSPFAISASRIEIPLPPFVSLTSVKYLDTASVEQTLSSTQYDVIDQGVNPAILQPAYGVYWPALRWGRPDAIRIQFVAGYASADSGGGLTGTIPPEITDAIMRKVSIRFDNRDGVDEAAVDALLTKFCVNPF